MKKAIIIGATSGLGLETARLLAQQGWQVGLAGRRLAERQALSVADAPRTGSTAHSPGHRAQETHRCHRLALPVPRFRLATDSALAMATDAREKLNFLYNPI